MITVNQVASAVYGCIVGNWLLNLFHTFTRSKDSEHRYVVVAQIQTGEYIRVLETESQSLAYDFEDQINADTNTITGFTFDRMMPGDKEELQVIEIRTAVPTDAEEREKLLAIIHDARKYW